MSNSSSSLAVCDSTSFAHPAHDSVGTVSKGEQAVVAVYPSCSHSAEDSCSDTEEESFSDTAAYSSRRKAVSFGLIQIREYNRVLGDNPTVRVGPAMSIGWEFVQKKAVPVDVYEKRKCSRTTSGLRMCSILRKCILRHEFDVSLEEIRAAEKIARNIQRQRWQTIRQGKMAAAIEYAMESAKRKMHRIFSNKTRLEGELPIRQKA
jgi:hypothetical protein